MKILAQAQADQVPELRVVPLALTSMWGSFFSRIEQRQGEPTAMVKPFRRGLFNRVGLNVGRPLAAQDLSPEALRAQVAHLLA